MTNDRKNRAEKKQRLADIAEAESQGHDVAELLVLDGLITLLEESLEGILDDDGKPDEHRHLCPNKACGTVWHHDRQTLKDKGEKYYDKAHTCPKCGHKTRLKYRGPKQATCFYDGVTLKEESAA